MSTKQRRSNLKKSKGRNKTNKSPTMLTYRPSRWEMPIPQRYRTNFYCEADFKLPSATSGPFTGVVACDSPKLPFYWGGSASFPSLTFLGPATAATLQPTGWSRLAFIYNQYKVIRSEMKLKVEGGTSLNNFSATILPMNNPSSSVTIYQARTLPYSVSGSFLVSKRNEGCDKEGFLCHRWEAGESVGYTPAEVKADTFEFVSTSSAGPAYGIGWKVFLITSTGDVTGTYDSLVRVRIKYEVEMFDTLAMNIPNT
jgi:hypothetical protein